MISASVSGTITLLFRCFGVSTRGASTAGACCTAATSPTIVSSVSTVLCRAHREEAGAVTGAKADTCAAAKRVRAKLRRMIEYCVYVDGVDRCDGCGCDELNNNRKEKTILEY